MMARSRHLPGLAPGTLIADPDAHPTSLSILRYSPSELVEESIPSLADLPEPSPDSTLWVDVVGLRDIDLLQSLGDRFGLHPLVVEDVVNVNQRPKTESYGPAELFVVAQLPDPTRGRYRSTTQQISIVAKPGLVVLFRERPGGEFDPIRDRLREGRGRIRGGGADYLTYALLDAVVDAFYPILLDLSAELEETEDEILDESAGTELRILHGIRRNLIRLRRSVLPLREAMAALLREAEDADFFRPGTAVFLRDAYDHATRTLEQIDNDRELAASLADLHLSLVGHRSNEVMKVLTMIATIFIPLSFLVGLYGMNFDTELPGNLPELSVPYAYPILLGTMGAIVVGFVVYFRRKNWL